MAAVACGSEDVAPAGIEPVGSPTVAIEDVQRHAEQFDRDLRRRPAGSQQEFAAATYLLSHLQRAGYVVQLDYVPVADLVRSTNVVAEAPEPPPAVVVVVAYDGTGGGAELGSFLEIARAIRVRAPGHSVGFVAMGAEHAEVSGGLLGSRRLARRLLDDDLDPTIVELGTVRQGEPLVAAGDAARGFAASAGSGIETSPEMDIVWDRAGFDHVVISGDPTELSAAVLGYLEGAAG